jgi:hypothetical protein
LAEIEGSLGHPLYWAGKQRGGQLEVTQEANGNVYLRYFRPRGMREICGFLAVGTYPVADAGSSP